MRRNALKNRKLNETKKWRREKQRRSGKLKSSSVKCVKTVPLLSQVTLRDVRVRVRRHSVDFLLSCKNPGSKERALLQQLEKPSCPKQAASAEEEKVSSSAVGLNPSTPNSSMPVNQAHRAAANSEPVKTAARPARSRTASKKRGTARTTRPAKAEPDAAAVPQPAQDDDTCDAATQVEAAKTTTESQNSNGAEPCVATEAESPEAEPVRENLPNIAAAADKAADDPVKCLKQFITVSLTRLSVPRSSEAEKLGEARSVAGKRRSKPKPAGKQASRPDARPEGETAEKETLVEPKGKVNLRRRQRAEEAEHPSRGEEQKADEIVEGRSVSEEQEDGKQKERQDVLEDKSEETSASNAAESKNAEEELKVSDEGQTNVQLKKRRNVGKRRAPKKSGQTKRSLKELPAEKTDDDVVIKQAKILLSDVLRKDQSLKNTKPQESEGADSCSTPSKEPEQHETDGNGSSHSFPTRGRKTLRRTVKTKAELKQSVKGHPSGENPVSSETDASERGFQPERRSHETPTTCLNALPHPEQIAAKANLFPDSNPQLHTQSNIPLKKRTFRSSVETDPEQSLSSASELKKPPEPSSASAPKLSSAAGSGENHVNRDKVKTACKKTTKQASVIRTLRPRANEAQRGHLLRKVRKCTTRRLKEDAVEDRTSQDLTEHEEAESKNLTLCGSSSKNELKANRLERSDSEETKPAFDFKFRLKRRRGKVWEMQNEGAELKSEKKEDLMACDPFKAIMDSVSILNMEMEAHVQASKKSKSRSDRLKHRHEKMSQRSDRGSEKAENLNEPSETTCEKMGVDKKEPRNRVQLKTETQNHKVEGFSPVVEPKIEDRFFSNCCLFESGPQQPLEPELGPNGLPLPVIKLRRKTEDIWEVDSKKGLLQPDLNTERKFKRETKSQSSCKTKGCNDLGAFKDETPSYQRLIQAPPKTDLPPFSLSLSPLSLSSPLSDKTEVMSSAADKTTERSKVSEEERKQRHKVDRLRKCVPVETPTTCLSHTLQQIDNSLSRLSEGLCLSQTLEKPPGCSGASNSVIQTPSESPPFTTADNILSGEPSFTNCCDDILDFQCLSFEEQNILPSSPSDLCSLDPPADPFSSPLSHSPPDTWTTETPYLGPPSPQNSFTSEDLQFFPGLISSKNDSVPFDCDAKDKDKQPPNPACGFAALGTSDLMSKDRSRNAGLRSSAVASKPRFYGSTSSSVATQNPVSFTQTSASIKPHISQSKAHLNLKAQGPFHRMTIPAKSSSFPANQGRGASSQTSSRFVPPQLFSVKNPNPPESPFNFQEKPSTVIHRVLKYQGGSQTHNLYSAPCKDAAGSPTASTKSLNSKSCEAGKVLKFGAYAEPPQKNHTSVHGFAKDPGPLASPANPGRSNLHCNKLSSSALQTFGKNKMSSDKQDGAETNATYKNFSDLPRPFFFPSKGSDCYPSPQDKSLKLDKAAASSSDKHQLCYTQPDVYDFNYSSSLSPISQHSTPPATPAPPNKSQPTAASASFPYGYQGPPYVLNFNGDHSLTLGLRDGTEGYPGSTNYTYHCLMEPSGTQGRLVLEPRGPQLQNPSGLGGFSGLKGQDEHCRKDMQQQQCPPGEHQGVPHYGPVPSSHSMGATKPKRVRLVVTDGTVDLDLQYSD